MNALNVRPGTSSLLRARVQLGMLSDQCSTGWEQQHLAIDIVPFAVGNCKGNWAPDARYYSKQTKSS